MSAVSASQIAAVRRFNRFYTREIGVLRKNFLETPWTLGEMRVLYEIAYGDQVTATDIAQALDLDAGYLSRLLQKFERDGLIVRTQSKEDARQSQLALTPKGRAAFSAGDERQIAKVRDMLGRLRPAAQVRVVEAMHAIETLVGERSPPEEAPGYTLHEPRAGDFGWIVARHGQLYSEEYGWNGNFEGLCAQIVADFVNKFDPKRERCWIAEMNGENVGTVMVVKDDPAQKRPEVARLRLLLVDPKARGLGLGTRLVDECLQFARAAKYKRMTLWTHSVLTAARAIYRKAGFTLTDSEPHESWGKKVVSEYWDKTL
jgi:DNA-binding MarR family transcriptional regulator/GNAT superfamily N-acetyltransferase